MNRPLLASSGKIPPVVKYLLPFILAAAASSVPTCVRAADGQQTAKRLPAQVIPSPAVADPRPVGDQLAVEAAPAPTQTDVGAAQARLTAVTATLLLKVVHPDDVRAKVVALTKHLGGHPVLVSDSELQLNVAPQHLGEVLDLLASSGIVIDKSLQRRDRTEAVGQLQARLRSKQEIFERLRNFLDDSTVSATLRIERSMTQLVTELEQIKGELSAETAATHFAYLAVRFDYHRQGRVTYVRSPFEWLNTVDLDQFLGGF